MAKIYNVKPRNKVFACLCTIASGWRNIERIEYKGYQDIELKEIALIGDIYEFELKFPAPEEDIYEEAEQVILFTIDNNEENVIGTYPIERGEVQVIGVWSGPKLILSQGVEPHVRISTSYIHTTLEKVQ